MRQSRVEGRVLSSGKGAVQGTMPSNVQQEKEEQNREEGRGIFI